MSGAQVKITAVGIQNLEVEKRINEFYIAAFDKGEVVAISRAVRHVESTGTHWYLGLAAVHCFGCYEY